MGPAEVDITSRDSEKRTILKLLVLAVLNSEVSAWTYHDSNIYMTWNEANEWCKTTYTNMVFIRNKNENKYLNETMTGHKPYYWIGIKKGTNGAWIWEETKKVVPEDVQSWAKEEPSNSLSEICVELYINRLNDSGKWNNERCGKKKMPLCYQDSCMISTCSHRGKCIEAIGNYTCVCWPGFYGNNCEDVESCMDLQSPEEGNMRCSDVYGAFKYKSICNFSCDNGFRLHGSKSLKCQSTLEWSNFMPTCLAESCMDLQSPEGGNMRCSDVYGEFNFKSICNFSCDNGFRLHGSKSSECQSTREWSDPIPTCLAESCMDLQSPEGGNMRCSDVYGEFKFKSICNFSCDNGFRLHGSKSSECQSTREWSDPIPTCLAESCMDLQSPEGGNMRCSDVYGEFKFKSICNFSCDNGFRLHGSKSSECQSTREWSDSIPTCLAESCMDLQSPEGGNVRCSDVYGEFKFKSICNFSCDNGFRLHGSKSSECQSTREWSDPIPTCLAVSCVDLQIPANGKIHCTVEYGKSQYKSFCNFSCDKGYELNGTNSVFCQNTGEWSENTPTCLAWDVSNGKQKSVTIVSSVLGTVGVFSSSIPIAFVLRYLRRKKENSHIIKKNKEPLNTFENPAFEEKEMDSFDL
ncbi:E-selectin-like [Mantella aurantiaca]